MTHVRSRPSQIQQIPLPIRDLPEPDQRRQSPEIYPEAEKVSFDQAFEGKCCKLHNFLELSAEKRVGKPGDNVDLGRFSTNYGLVG